MDHSRGAVCTHVTLKSLQTLMPIPLFTVLCGHPRLPGAALFMRKLCLRRRMLLGGGCKDARNTSGVPPAGCGTTRAGPQCPAGAPQPRGGGPGAPLSPGGRGQARAGRRQAPPLPAGCSAAGRAGRSRRPEP